MPTPGEGRSDKDCPTAEAGEGEAFLQREGILPEAGVEEAGRGSNSLSRPAAEGGGARDRRAASGAGTGEGGIPVEAEAEEGAQIGVAGQVG